MKPWSRNQFFCTMA